MNRNFIFLVFGAILMLTVFPSRSFGTNDAKKAAELMAAGRYEEAISLLETHIQKDSKNAEAYYQLGICSVHLNRFADADTFFSTAANQQPDLKERIYDALFKIGDSLSGDQKAQCLTIAMKYGDKFDSEIRKILCDLYYDLGKATKNRERAINFISSLRHCETHAVEIKKDLIALMDKVDPGDFYIYLKAISEVIPIEEIFNERLKKYEKIWGKPKKIELTDDEWVSVFTIERFDRIHWLCLDSFSSKYDKIEGSFPASFKITRGKGSRPNIGGEGKILYFKKEKKPTTVYVWLERAGRPVDLN